MQFIGKQVKEYESRLLGWDTMKYWALVYAWKLRIVTVKQRPQGQMVAESECFADLIANAQIISMSWLWMSISRLLKFIH